MACWCLQLSPSIHPGLKMVGFDAVMSISLSMSLEGASIDDVAVDIVSGSREKSGKVEREQRRVSSFTRSEDRLKSLGRGDGGGGGVGGELFPF